MRFVINLLLIGCLLACNNSGERSSSLEGASASASDQSKSANVTPPPAIPTEILLDVYENCDYIDFIFPNLPFSISQEDKSSIQQTMRHINNVQPSNYNPDCPYFAQQIFQENGEIVLDAKIFFEPTCTYYLFYENGLPVYSASFTNEGIEFYRKILAQAQQM
ncbi:hypothetical protein [Portibacter marinus]|uniref:hypothetical protein n=1 Tax=Portibacter marinus TaxID=2898660 RepID=UPI001F29048D|nr:hypothetical protein [Portibacter marinus]